MKAGYCFNSSPTEEVTLARKPLHVSLRATFASLSIDSGEAIPPFFKTWTAERLDCHPFAEFILSEAEGLWASAY